MKYRTIVADPPWRYAGAFPAGIGDKYRNRIGQRSSPLPYPSLAIDEIRALPVDALADDDCRLFLWTTNHHLPDAFGVLGAWGFEYRQTCVWHKPSGAPVGSIASNRSEFLLVGVCGTPPRLWRWKSSVVVASSVGHSRKPEVFIDLIEASSPGPYLELFARRNRLGWDTWGNEALEHVSLTGSRGER